ncbi:alpha/beta fold hydrolase [Geothrix sp. PMB-07]|uniref:alpha/beta hydrolase family protein n=1 Tax=Geothrix sp. PMB-07 TaxID=3068640 RepID=UPI0027418294|nr:alpha/beta fold hydrolase [Geothrix sp. PMB-07]WLT30992.1 alpha/beta fold hydrolase [Geothrix sp. PMB-07]
MIWGRPQPIFTEHGHPVWASYYRPDGPIKGAVLIVPGLGALQRHYAPLASWLAEQGYFAATFDYAGTGMSCLADVRKLRITISDWASGDCDAMVSALAEEVPGKPLYWLGHSLGGEILGLLPGPERIRKAVTIATGTGYWQDRAPGLRWRVWWLWYFMAPLVTGICGYFPGSRLGRVGDLPPGVMKQWRRWCLHPDSAVGVEGPAARESFAAVQVPITSFSFTDDERTSARSTEALHGWFENAPRTMKRLSPKDLGTQRVGHFGFFHARLKKALWETFLLPELT